MMKQVSLRVGGRRKLFVTTVLGALVATAAAQGVASAQTRETAIRTLGGPNRFSGPMHSVDDANDGRNQPVADHQLAATGGCRRHLHGMAQHGQYRLRQRRDGRTRYALRLDGAQASRKAGRAAQRAVDRTAVV